jgi:hypothetical protein
VGSTLLPAVCCLLPAVCWLGGGPGGAGRTGRGSQEVAPPVLRSALARGTTGFGMGPGGSPPRSRTPGAPGLTYRSTAHCAMSTVEIIPQSSSLLLCGCVETSRVTGAGRRGSPRTSHRCKSAFRPCAPLRSDGCPPSTRGRSTRWSAGGLMPSVGRRGSSPGGVPT